MRALIISQPKAGTYLCQNLLGEFGLHKSMVHINPHNYHLYDAEQLSKGRTSPNDYIRVGNINEALAHVPENGVAVTHLQRNEETQKAFQSLKKICLTRPRQERESSSNRWQKVRPGGVNLNVEHANWQDLPDVFSLTFADMIECNTDKLDKLQIFLFGEIKHNSLTCMQTALQMDSLTKSEIR